VRWFYYSPIDRNKPQLPIFRPALINPGPWLTENGDAESRAQFEQRILEQIKSQLTIYCDQVWRILGSDHPELRKHAAWTALAFSGLSFTKIARLARGFSQTVQPDVAVQVSVKRFAGRIDLRLPSRRRG
jgi:hypothetical protein